MAALTAAKQTPIQGRGFKKQSYPLKAAAKVFKGGFVNLDAGGQFVVAGADTASQVCVGIAEESVDNTSGANGDLEVNVIFDCIATVIGSGLAQANVVGTSVEITDDQTVVAPGAGVNHVKVGPIVRFRSATDVDIYVCGLTAAKP